MKSPKIAILYNTTDGHTLTICERIIYLLNQQDLFPELFEINHFDRMLGEYDLVLIGASIRYGHHHNNVIDFIKDHKEELKQVKTAFFSVNLVARKPEKNTVKTNPYVIKFFKQVTWKPELGAVFAGVLDYPRYGFFDRMMIKLIMKITGGPTTGDGPIEYTNWEHVEAFAQSIAKAVHASTTDHVEMV